MQSTYSSLSLQVYAKPLVNKIYLKERKKWGKDFEIIVCEKVDLWWERSLAEFTHGLDSLLLLNFYAVEGFYLQQSLFLASSRLCFTPFISKLTTSHSVRLRIFLVCNEKKKMYDSSIAI